MELVARDAIGTAHSNASVATSRMKEWLDSRKPREFELRAVINLLTHALSDVVLAQHQLDPNWTEATYVGIWDRPNDTTE